MHTYNPSTTEAETTEHSKFKASLASTASPGEPVLQSEIFSLKRKLKIKNREVSPLKHM